MDRSRPIISEGQFKNSLFELPVPLLSVIGQYLELPELSRYCQISQKVNNVCANEKLWQAKISRDYGNPDLKPDTVTNLQWYRELDGTNILRFSPKEILDFSVKNGYIKLARWAIKKGIEINNGESKGGVMWLQQNEDEEWLERATKKGDYDMVKLLLENHIKIDSPFSWPLVYAARSGSHKIIQLLLEHGDKRGISEASVEATRNGDYDSCKLLFKFGAILTEKHNQALLMAKVKGYDNIVNFLVEQGADTNILQGDSLSQAVKNNYEDVIQVLSDNGADLNVNNGDFLLRAIRNSKYDIIETLLENGADPNAPSGNELKQALYDRRCRMGAYDLDHIKRLLLEYGAKAI